MQSTRVEPLPIRRRLPRPSSRLLLAIPLLAIAAIGLVRWQQRSPIAEYPLADRSSVPAAIAVGLDGTAWFTTNSRDPVGAVRDGHVEMVVRGTASIVSTGIAVDPSGNVWYTDDQGRAINRVAPAGSRAHFQLPTGVSRLGGLIADRADEIWFTDSITNALIVLRDSQFTPYPLPTDDAEPAGLARDADGAIWFTERKAGKLGRLGPGGDLAEVDIPTPNSQPGSISVDPSGAVWFTEVRVNKIGRYAGGRFAEFAVPTERAGLAGLVAVEGAVWFAETRGARIGRLRDGKIVEIGLPSESGRPFGLARAPDGALWYTDITGRIGRLPPEMVRST